MFCSGRLGDFQSFFEICIPQRHGILIVAMGQFAQRHPEDVLCAGQFETIFDIRLLFAEGLDPRKIACRQLHVIRQFRSEQIGAGIREIGGLQCKPCRNE